VIQDARRHRLCRPAVAGRLRPTTGEPHFFDL